LCRCASYWPGGCPALLVSVRVRETQRARIKYAEAHDEIVRLTLEVASKLIEGETVTLKSDRLSFKVELTRRRSTGSQVLVRQVIEGDDDALRVERVRRAFNQKCPKLETAAARGRTSVLVIESNDGQLADVSSIYAAVKIVVAERKSKVPDVIVLVETDAVPMHGWVLKEGDSIGNEVPVLSGRRLYVEGELNLTSPS
jgi:hypothetical protein